MDEFKKSDECLHSWEYIKEDDYGEMNYSSYGGGVEHFKVILYRCKNCGKLKKEHNGEICGDGTEYLEITAEDKLYVKSLKEKE